MATLSRHAGERGKERVGLNVRAMTRLAERAWTTGQPPAAYAGSFRRYLDALAMRKSGCRVRVYGEFVFLFDASWEHVITVVNVPSKFRRLLRRQRQQES